MQAESTEKPQSLVITRFGDTAELVFCEAIRQETRETGTYYVFEEYRMCVPYRENLQQQVAKNRKAWLAAAKQEPKRTPSAAEQLAQLEEDRKIMGQALEEVISLVVGG